MSVSETKKNLLEHSAAKVELYTSYLKRYLMILGRSEYVQQIYLYDVFCGIGIYENGGKGSPVQAFELIKSLKDRGDINKKIYLWLNDNNKKRVTRVERYIEENYPNQQSCSVTLSCLDANDCLTNIRTNILNSPKDSRHLLFIDPYGYKLVKKCAIDALLSLGHVEVLVFLPIDNIYRFARYAIEHKSEPQFVPLADFVIDFFRPGHVFYDGGIKTEKEFIDSLCDAFSADGKYYSTSYYIERSSNKFYALFFITTNALGCEKMLETKWKLDEVSGKGFIRKEPNLFSDLFVEEEQLDMYNMLKDKLVSFLRTDKTNEDIYDYVLRNGFLPRHANEILRALQNDGHLEVKSLGKPSIIRKGAFYIKYLPPSQKERYSLLFRIV